jgi:hypothetical protein
MCINMCIEICDVCSNKHTLRLAYDQDGYVHSELHLEPKFRKVGRAHFRFWSNEDRVISNFGDLLYTIENTLAPISALKVGLYQIIDNATPPRKLRWVA